MDLPAEHISFKLLQNHVLNKPTDLFLTAILKERWYDVIDLVIYY